MGDEIHSRVISRGIPLESPQIASLFSYLKCHGYEVHIVEVDPSQDEINPPSATLSIYHKFEEFNSVRHSPEVLASIQLVSDVVHYASLKPREEGWARMKAKSLEVKLGIIDSKRDERLVCEDLQRACSSLSTTLNGKRFFNDEKMFSSVDIQFLGAALVAHHCLDKSTSRVRCIIDSHLNLAAFVERFSSIEPRIDQQLHSETIREMVEASQPLELGSQIPSIRPAIRFVRANGRDYVLKGSVPGSVAFFTEVELLRNMRLGRVVQMMGCGEYEFGRFRNWIVLKYYPQGNLEEYFRGLPNLKDCLLILEQVAYGIYQFQTHNYPFNVHCDLKPYNIYLEENNAFIGDFGACLVDGDMRGSGGSMVYCESRNDIVVRQQDVCSVGLIILRAFALPGLFIDGDGLTLEQWRERIKDVLARSSVWEGYSLSLFREGITAECSDVFATELLSLVNNCIKLPYQARPDIYSVVKHLRDIRCRLNFCDALPEDF